jgi:hypothetical protein
MSAIDHDAGNRPSADSRHHNCHEKQEKNRKRQGFKQRLHGKLLSHFQ